jgi:S1-C subfamily serine protease
MNWHRLKLFACFGGFSVAVCASALYFSVSARCQTVSCQVSSVQQPPTQLSKEELYKQAEAISVKVKSRDFLGTGILLKREDTVYTILTNAHVLRAGNAPYKIQTPDGRIYTADLPKGDRLGKNDLALLQFRSNNNIYAVASLSENTVVGDEVFAAGFPFMGDEPKEKGFVLTEGKVSLLLPKALEGGYQVGYTNDIEKGMSGGPLLNRQGQLVGVNGMHAFPLWDAPSMFADGSEAGKVLHEKIVRLSWAVPIETVKKAIAF